MTGPLVAIFSLVESSHKLYDIRSYGYPKMLRSFWEILPNSDLLSEVFPGERFIFSFTVALIGLLYRFYPDTLSNKEYGYLRLLLGKNEGKKKSEDKKDNYVC